MAARKVSDGGATAFAPQSLGRLLGPAAGSLASLEVVDLVLDSRQVTAGAAFVAVPGATSHGLDHVAAALANGAVVVLYEPRDGAERVPGPSVAVPGLRARLGELARAFFGAPPRELFGVTGTNGKTTVAYLIAQALAAVGRSCGYIGTLGHGVPPQIEPHALTTPDTLTLHRELARLAVPAAALEVSSHALAQERIDGLTFPIAVLTNLTRDHLDAHGDLAAYARAKARLFERPGVEHAVLNANDPFGAELAARLAPRVRVTRYSVGAHAPAELTATIAADGPDGLRLDVRCTRPGEPVRAARLTSTLIGAFNADNLLAALGALLAAGVELDAACAALGRAHAAPGRMEVIRPAGAHEALAPTVIVDYAHTPDALERVLAAVRGFARGDVWCVFGCGGERDPGKRPLMGRAAALGAKHVVLTDDNPRGEDPAAIVAAIRAGIDAAAAAAPRAPSVTVLHDRAAAIRHAVGAARPADVVLIAGKGHETTQIAAGVARAFDDRAAARAALGERR